MSWFERVVRALIYICFLALGFYLILWVLSAIGFALPYMVITILKVIFVLFAILLLFRLFGDAAWFQGPWFPGPKPPPG